MATIGRRPARAPLSSSDIPDGVVHDVDLHSTLDLGNKTVTLGSPTVTGTITTSNHGTSAQWNTAYGWGDHSAAGYQAASSALTTATTFSGDVSGTYNSIVVADNSHNHEWTNITNLPDPVITLAGDVSGSATMTDLGSVTITVTVADDSHNHVISNVDGLQTALNAKQDASTALTTSTTFGGDVSGTYNAIVVADDSHNHVISNVDGLQSALDDLTPTSNDTFSGTYPLVWVASDVLYSSTFMTINGSTDTLSVPNISASGDLTVSGSAEVGGVYLEDLNGTVTSRWGIYAWDDELQFTKRNLSTNAHAGTVLALNYSTSQATFAGTISSGAITSTGTSTFAGIRLNNANTALSQGSGNAVRITTNSGYIDVGPMNTSYTHFQTDRARFYFQQPVHFDGQIYNYDGGATSQPYWHAGNDGSGSGLDADLLDGINSTGFVKQLSETANTNYTTPSSRRVNPNSNNPTNTYYAVSTFGNDGNVTGQLATHFQTGQPYTRGHNNSWSAWQTIWTNVNDGSGSGLDADLLDGLNSTQFIRSDTQATTSAPLTIGVNWGQGNFNSAFVIQGSYPSWETRGNSSQPYGWLHHQDSNGQYTLYSIAGYTGNNWTQRFTFNRDGTFRNGGAAGNIYWHAGNDGSGSGLDADLLDGYHSATTGANVNLRTASQGYLLLDNWIRTGAGGIYSSTNSAHWSPNGNSSYGAWVMTGARNNYTGILFAHAGGANNNGQHFMWDSSGNGGIWSAANTGSWTQYYRRDRSCTGFNASTTSSSYTIYVTGAIYATGNIVAYSDARVKENVVTIDNALEIVEQMRGVYYNKIDDPEKRTEIGFIAQEVDAVEGAKPLVTYAEDTDEYGVSYGNTTALLVNAVKELSQQVKDLKAELEALKNG